MKWSIATKMLPTLQRSASTDRKSTHTSSRGFELVIVSVGSYWAGSSAACMAKVSHLVFTSLALQGQKNLSRTSATIHSVPKCAKSPWNARKANSQYALGSTSCVVVSSRLLVMTQYRTPCINQSRNHSFINNLPQDVLSPFPGTRAPPFFCCLIADRDPWGKEVADLQVQLLPPVVKIHN